MRWTPSEWARTGTFTPSGTYTARTGAGLYTKRETRLRSLTMNYMRSKDADDG
jgi:hypothetical protein